MAKEALVQVRIEKSVKDCAEEFYKDMGTSFAEMVRVMAAKTVNEQKLPFEIKRVYKGKAFGALKKYAKNGKKGLTNSDMTDIAWNDYIEDRYVKNNRC